MDLKEAVAARHSVRRYLDKPLTSEQIATLQAAISRINAASGLHIQLVLDEPKAFSTGLFKYGAFSGVKNYLVMAGKKGGVVEEAVGYYGEELVLLAQTLGLNTCWVGLTYKRILGTYRLNPGERVHCVISLGYGETPGVQHPMKPRERFFEAEGPLPDWFVAGLDAALLAPTAINQQKFKFILLSDGRVEARALRSLAGYTRMDLGIARYHFEIGAAPERVNWK
ncbi:MAG: nitroreductase [Bacteroidales bacterium]|nr:nitroreductase [Bacteroidales bacterium]